MTSELEFLNALSRLGPIGAVLVFVALVIYLYARMDTARRDRESAAAVEAEKQRRMIATARAQAAEDTRRELTMLYNEIRKEAKERELRYEGRIGALEKENENYETKNRALDDQLDSAKEAVRQSIEQSQRCQSAMEAISAERDKIKTERDKLKDDNVDLLARLSSYEEIQRDLGKQVQEAAGRETLMAEKIEAQAQTIADLEKKLTAIGHDKISPSGNDATSPAVPSSPSGTSTPSSDL